MKWMSLFSERAMWERFFIRSPWKHIVRFLMLWFIIWLQIVLILFNNWLRGSKCNLSEINSLRNNWVKMYSPLWLYLWCMTVCLLPPKTCIMFSWQTSVRIGFNFWAKIFFDVCSVISSECNEQTNGQHFGLLVKNPGLDKYLLKNHPAKFLNDDQSWK